MSLLAPWLLFPIALGALALGCGLAVEQLARAPVPGALLLPLGFAAIVVVGELATVDPTTAQLTIPAVVALAIAGLGHGLWHRRLGLDGWAVGAALGVFAVFAAPVVLSGQATFAGYIKLDDTATFLALTDRALEHGRSLAGLAPSSYEATLWVNLAHGYPVGSLLPLGVGRTLVGQDGAWVYQPYLAFLAGLLALTLYELAGRAVNAKPLRAAIAAIAAQPALLYGFALWGGVKELAAAPLVALVAALAPSALDRVSAGAVLPVTTSAAALFGVLSLGGAPWVLPPLAATLVLTRRGRRPLVQAGALVGGLLLLSSPTLLDAGAFVSPGTKAAVRSSTVLGNLVRPLDPLQAFGVWPTGDFRFTPADLEATRVLVATVALLALVGVFLAWRARAWGALTYVGTAVGGCAAIAALASPWVVAKGYAIGSPALLFAAALGAAALIGRGRTAEGAVALAAVAGGVLWSNVLAYRDVNLAPRAQLRELELIGHRFAGQGPALMTEYQPYGVRHFLRALDAEGASELRRRPILLRNGTMLDKGASADLDAFEPSSILVYRTLVLRRSPLASRPPAVYRLVWRGLFYEVWERPRVVDFSLTHLPLGTEADPLARPSCAAVRSLARRGGSVVAAGAASSAIVVGLGRAEHPPEWPVAPGGLVAYPSGPGTVRAAIRLRTAGRYTVWVGGSFRHHLAALVDGRPVGSRADQLNNAGQYTALGEVTLGTREHVVELRYTTGLLAPGGGGTEYGLGPLVVSRSGEREPMARLPASQAGALCGRTLDWIETAAS